VASTVQDFAVTCNTCRSAVHAAAAAAVTACWLLEVFGAPDRLCELGSTVLGHLQRQQSGGTSSSEGVLS
jgi:hypothetical protein